MRMRKKPNLVPRMERCSDLLIREPEAGTWRRFYPGCTGLYLEIGCGKGKFTAETAAQNPDKLFIAMERVPEALVMAMEKAMSMECRNLFFVQADAENLVDYFAGGEIDRLYINFCDPWPSRKHANRRLTSPVFLEKYKQLLNIGAEIHFKTDNRQLFEYSLEQFERCGFECGEVTFNLHADRVVGIMTGYEEKFYLQGTSICRCVATTYPT